MEELAKEIREFLASHAKIDANYDPDFWEYEDRWGSPDASELDYAASELEAGRVPGPIHSTWASGGYAPWEDKMARRRHDELLKKIRELTSE